MSQTVEFAHIPGKESRISAFKPEDPVKASNQKSMCIKSKIETMYEAEIKFMELWKDVFIWIL